MFISRKELNKIENRAFLRGYDAGKRDGEYEGLMKQYSPNDIRRILSLPPIEKEDAKG